MAALADRPVGRRRGDGFRAAASGAGLGGEVAVAGDTDPLTVEGVDVAFRLAAPWAAGLNGPLSASIDECMHDALHDRRCRPAARPRVGMLVEMVEQLVGGRSAADVAGDDFEDDLTLDTDYEFRDGCGSLGGSYAATGMTFPV
jgi:hypothetical protein